MSTEIKLPELGEGVESGDVVKILVAPGDRVEKDQVLVELETDKAVVEVPATAAGQVETIHVSEGDEVKVGQVIVTLKEGGGAADPAKEKPAAERESEPAAVPEPDDSETEAPAPSSASTERSTERPPAEPDSRSTPAKPEPKPPATEAASEPTPPAGRTGPSAASKGGVPAPASPAVRRLARQIGVDVEAVRGSGPGGRISEEDVMAHARARGGGGDAGTGGPAMPGPVPPGQIELPELDFDRYGEVQRESMSRVRKKIAQQMGLAWSTIPHVTHYDEADITDLERQRKAVSPRVEEAGAKLTMTAILLKVVAGALQRHPKLNASLDIMNEEVIYKGFVNIGVAVDTERGLLVPSLKNVDRLSLTEIAVELNSLAGKARTGKVDLEDLRGASFTVTNLGGIGGVGFSPLINPPEVAVLGVSRASMRPVYREGGFVPRLIMPFSLSYDHRLVDGADAARFCRDVAETLETPLSLLLDAE